AYASGELVNTTGVADITGDGVCNDLDVEQMGIIVDEFYRRRADLTGDGKVDQLDVNAWANPLNRRDINGDGLKNSADLAALQSIAAKSAEVALQVDVNRDGILGVNAQTGESDADDFQTYVLDADNQALIKAGDAWGYYQTEGGFRSVLAPSSVFTTVPAGWSFDGDNLTTTKAPEDQATGQAFTIEFDAGVEGLYTFGISGRNPHPFIGTDTVIELNVYVNGDYSYYEALNINNVESAFQNVTTSIYLEEGINTITLMIWDLNGDGDRAVKGELPANLSAGYGVGLEIEKIQFERAYNMALDFNADGVLTESERQMFFTVDRNAVAVTTEVVDSAGPVIVGGVNYDIMEYADRYEFGDGYSLYTCSKDDYLVTLADGKLYAVTVAAGEFIVSEVMPAIQVEEDARYITINNTMYLAGETAEEGMISLNDGVSEIFGDDLNKITVDGRHYAVEFSGAYSTLVLKPATDTLADHVIYLNGIYYWYRYDDGVHTIILDGVEYEAVPLDETGEEFSVVLSEEKTLKLVFDEGKPFLRDVSSAVSEMIPMGEALEIYRVDGLTGVKEPDTSSYVRVMENTNSVDIPEQIVPVTVYAGTTPLYTVYITILGDQVIFEEGLVPGSWAEVNVATKEVEIHDASGVIASERIPEQVVSVQNAGGATVGNVTVDFDEIIAAAIGGDYTASLADLAHITVSSDTRPHIFRYWDVGINQKVVSASLFEGPNEVAYIDDIKFRLKVDTEGRVFIQREYAESEPLYDQVITLQGVTFNVTRNYDGTFTFRDENELYPAYQSTFQSKGLALEPIVSIFDVEYLILVNSLTGSITLREIPKK
ncbi:MAG: hypothetical protein WBD17_04405, partial [Candidatus Omnitrophota bacterium]